MAIATCLPATLEPRETRPIPIPPPLPVAVSVASEAAKCPATRKMLASIVALRKISARSQKHLSSQKPTKPHTWYHP